MKKNILLNDGISKQGKNKLKNSINFLDLGFQPLANNYLKKDQLKTSEKYLKWTLILGLGFTLSQTLIWSSLFDSGVYFTGPGSNASGSFFYVLTLLHLLHLAAGIIALIITYKNLIFGLYSSQNLLGVELCAIFWHFLDILWIFLFLFLLTKILQQYLFLF